VAPHCNTGSWKFIATARFVAPFSLLKVE